MLCDFFRIYVRDTTSFNDCKSGLLTDSYEKK